MLGKKGCGQVINMLSFSAQTRLRLAAVRNFRRSGRSDDRWRRNLQGDRTEGIAEPAARRVPMREFSRSLPMSLLRAREAVMRQFRPSLRHHGLTEQQWRILRALAAVEAIEVTELAHIAFLLGPSLSRILRDLETRRLIERRTAESDLRRGVVSISDKGLRLMEGGRAVLGSRLRGHHQALRRAQARGVAGDAAARWRRVSPVWTRKTRMTTRRRTSKCKFA